MYKTIILASALFLVSGCELSIKAGKEINEKLEGEPNVAIVHCPKTADLKLHVTDTHHVSISEGVTIVELENASASTIFTTADCEVSVLTEKASKEFRDNK